MFEYQIDGKVYEQRKLVWGQVNQLVGVVKGIEFSAGMTALDLINILGDKLPTALAVVLTEKGKSVKEKDIAATAESFAFTVELDVAMQVIEDFFVCNPIASYLEKIGSLVGKMTDEMNKVSQS